MGWDERLDEAKANAPEAAKHRSRKDRKRWCRGKVGVEHVLEQAYQKYALSWVSGRGELPKCQWVEIGHYKDVAGQRSRVFVGEDVFYWSCQHEYVCTGCGKIFERAKRRCAKFHPHDRDHKVVGAPRRSGWRYWLYGDG